jgi:hypothetical protein
MSDRLKGLLKNLEYMKNEVVYLWLTSMNGRGLVLAPRSYLKPRYVRDVDQFNEDVISGFKKKSGLEEEKIGG